MDYWRRNWIKWAIGSLVVLLVIYLLAPKHRTVCYEYKIDTDEASEENSEVGSETGDYSDFNEDSEVVCHYANTSNYSSYYWHTSYVNTRGTYVQGKEVSESDAKTKYDNVNDLQKVDNSSMKKSSSKSSSDSVSKSSSKSNSGSKSSGRGGGGKSSGS